MGKIALGTWHASAFVYSQGLNRRDGLRKESSSNNLADARVHQKWQGGGASHVEMRLRGGEVLLGSGSFRLCASGVQYIGLADKSRVSGKWGGFSTVGTL